MAVMSFFHNPHRFMAGSKWPAWGFTILGIALIVTGFSIGFFRTPEDFQQDERARMMFVHVPAMWLCMFSYAFMVGASFISFVWRHALADVAAKSAAPVGAVFTAVVVGVHFFLGVHLGAAFAVAFGATLALGFHFAVPVPVALAFAAAAGWVVEVVWASRAKALSRPTANTIPVLKRLRSIRFISSQPLRHD